MSHKRPQMNAAGVTAYGLQMGKVQLIATGGLRVMLRWKNGVYAVTKTTGNNLDTTVETTHTNLQLAQRQWKYFVKQLFGETIKRARKNKDNTVTLTGHSQGDYWVARWQGNFVGYVNTREEAYVSLALAAAERLRRAREANPTMAAHHDAVQAALFYGDTK